MSSYTYQLVLQLPASTQEDLDDLLEVEEALRGSLEGLPHDLDGRDFGSGEMNIFIHTNDPEAAFKIALGHYSPRERLILKAAHRRFDGRDYTSIWPHGTEERFQII